jgi:hypothetical protein
MTVLTRGDRLVDSAADRLQRLAGKFASQGGTKAKLGEELFHDAAFIRKLKPSLMAARYRGEAPTNQPPGESVEAPSGPQLPPRPKPKRTGGPNPFLVCGLAFAAGVVAARVIHWRSNVHHGD